MTVARGHGSSSHAPSKFKHKKQSNDRQADTVQDSLQIRLRDITATLTNPEALVVTFESSSREFPCVPALRVAQDSKLAKIGLPFTLHSCATLLSSEAAGMQTVAAGTRGTEPSKRIWSALDFEFANPDWQCSLQRSAEEAARGLGMPQVCIAVARHGA